MTDKPEVKPKPDQKPAAKKPVGVAVRFRAASWGRKRGAVEHVPADVADRLVRDGHADRI